MSIINDQIIMTFLRKVFADAETGDALLDLGCGQRPYAGIYEGKARRVIAADYEVRGPVHVRLDAARLPFADACFDTVLLSEVLEHLNDPSEALLEIARVLKPDGRLILTVPFNYMQHEIPHDYWRWTSFGLVKLLECCQFRVQVVYQRGGLVALLLAQLEFAVKGMCELLCRKLRVKMIRQVFWLLGCPWRFAVALSLGGLWSGNVQYAVDGAATGGRRWMAAGTRGAAGQLRLWTLGFCVVATKVGSGNGKD